MLRIVCLIASVFLAAACNSTAADEPIVVLISIDGLGAPLMRAVDTPTLDKLKASGVSTDRMQPVYPTMTFPNHYSIATGLYPSEHGIVNNTFPNSDRSDWYTLYDRSKVQDGSWYGGQPIWVLAEQNGMTAKSYYFVGTEAPINGIKPTVAYDFDPDVPGSERVETALGWLAEAAVTRPRIITLYFEDVDRASHDDGPTSPEAIAGLRRVDNYLKTLTEGVESLPIAESVHYVVVSDHGQDAYREDLDVFILDTVVDLENAL